MRRSRAFAVILLALSPATQGWAASARIGVASLPPSSAAPTTIAPVFAAPTISARFTVAPVALIQPAAGGAPLIDAVPAAPDFGALTPARRPKSPAPWTPSSSALKPVAAAVNAWNDARRRHRIAHPRPGERVTTEELDLRESLSGLHAAIADGRFQDAMTTVAGLYQTRTASSWYQENPGYRPYRSLAFDYMRFAERAVLKAYGRAHARGGDAALIAEARDAASLGRIQGRAWRPTAIQEKDSSLCVQHALFNAILASVGFARPTSVGEFVAASRAALNRAAKLDRPANPAEIAALSKSLGVDFGGRDVGAGMDTRSMVEWASLMGMKLASRAPPRGEAGWSALLGPGREVLLSLRMFHPKYAHSASVAAARGHDYMVLHHEVYLLGAFDSPSLGARLFLLQDSGSGSTVMATAEELTALVVETQVLTTAGPVSVPQRR